MEGREGQEPADGRLAGPKGRAAIRADLARPAATPRLAPVARGVGSDGLTAGWTSRTTDSWAVAGGWGRGPLRGLPGVSSRP